jgi:outer membrane receptor protein involved in Fe transport
MYLDESPINTVGLNPDLHIYDMERIEVLNGPQGTLYGSSAQGGTVKLITNKPQREEFEAGFEVDASGGQEAANSDSFEGFINIPVSDSLAARVSAYNVTEGGFIDLVGGTKTFSASNST